MIDMETNSYNMNGNTRRDKYVVIYGATDKNSKANFRFRSDSNTPLIGQKRHRSTGNKNIFIFAITLPIQRSGSLCSNQ